MVSPRVPYPCRACDEPVPVRTSSFDRVGGRLSDDNRREPASDCRRHRPERPDALPVVLALLPAESLRAICQEGRKHFTGGRQDGSEAWRHD